MDEHEKQAMRDAGRAHLIGEGPVSLDKDMVSAMKLYNMTIRLMDTSLPYPDRESAQKDAEEWARGLADQEQCVVVDVTVEEAV